jgi:hypothetical protein
MALQLTYAELKAAVYERRFPTSSPVDQWLAAAYSSVWAAGDWTFTKVPRATFYTTADGLSTGAVSATPLMPSAFREVTGLYDDQGDELAEYAQRDFERFYTEQTPSTGRPDRFMVVNRQITLYPTPDAKYAYKLSYRRRLATRNAAGTVQAGFFVLDSDIPLWDDHHYLLVLRAKILGLRDRSDPTADDLTDEYMALLEAMRADYAERLPIAAQLPAWR